MYILLLFQSSLALIQKLQKGYPIKYNNNLLAKTVVLIETELLHRRSEFEDWQPAPDADDIKTLVDIFVSKENDWKDIDETGKLVAEYERTGAKNSFFFTASENKYFLYELSADFKGSGEYALKTNIYEGRQSDPRIISQADNQIKDLANNIEQAIEYTKQISDIQKLDALADAQYRMLIGSIGSIVLWVIVMKIAVFYCMFYYFNRKLREFYVSKKIVAK